MPCGAAKRPIAQATGRCAGGRNVPSADQSLSNAANVMIVDGRPGPASEDELVLQFVALRRNRRNPPTLKMYDFVHIFDAGVFPPFQHQSLSVG